jgi:hypothetical protein
MPRSWSRYRRAVTAGAAIALASAVAVPVSAVVDVGPPATATGPLAGGADLEEALRLEHVIDWHIWNRQVTEIEYRSTARDPYEVGAGVVASDRYPGVAKLTDFTDSGLWTGTYVAANAFRYQVALRYLRGPLTGQERRFWAAQRDEALGRVRPFLEQYHLNVNISREWTRATGGEPSVTPPNGTDVQATKVDAGEGVFPGGEPGMLFRTCIPASAPDRLTWDYTLGPDGSRVFKKDTVYGPFSWSDDLDPARNGSYYCEDGTSRDTYAGVTFGIVTALDLIGPAMGDQLYATMGQDLMVLTRFLVRHGWSVPRPHSKVVLRNDLSSLYSPLFLYTPTARLHMAGLARHAAALVGTEADRAEFEAVWQEELATQGPGVAVSEALDTADPTGSYYKWNLEHLIAFDLFRIEQDPATVALLKQGFSVMDATTGDDVNAHFEAITFSITGEPTRRDAAITHLRQWRDWRARYEDPNLQFAANSAKCGVSIACKPADEDTAMLPAPDGTTIQVPPSDTPCTGTACRAVEPLPIRDRVPTDFLWQRSSFQLDSRRSATHESQGIDYLLPYWMMRYLTEVRAPILAPFPAWAGPRYR